jgi:uncharacterized protein YjlB
VSDPETHPVSDPETHPVSDPETYSFEDDGGIPNSSLPVLVYHDVAAAAGGAAACQELFEANRWLGAWRDGIFSFHHFHSTAHEVLGVVQGSARVMLGGPQGREFEVGVGDVLVLPAGTGHRNLGSSGDFVVVGAYPDGMSWDIRRGDPAEHDEAVARIRAVPLPSADPVAGREGLVELWR